MKKIILVTSIVCSALVNALAQTAPDLIIYQGGINNLSYQFDNFGTKHVDSVGGTNTPYEGNSQYYFAYSSAGQTWGGQIYFNIDVATVPVDFTDYTYVVFNWKGTADINYNTLSVSFEDLQYDGTNSIAVATNSASTTYQQTVIELDDFDYTTNPVDKTNIKGMALKMCCNNATGSWFLDNIYFTNTMPTTGTKKITDNAAFSINPNPSSGLYSINGSEKVDEIVVTNHLGAVVMKTTHNGPLDLTNQPDGIYFVTLSSGDKMTTKKLIKNR